MHSRLKQIRILYIHMYAYQTTSSLRKFPFYHVYCSARWKMNRMLNQILLISLLVWEEHRSCTSRVFTFMSFSVKLQLSLNQEMQNVQMNYEPTACEMPSLVYYLHQWLRMKANTIVLIMHNISFPFGKLSYLTLVLYNTYFPMYSKVDN